MRRIVSLALALCFVLFLSACESSEERAESHYQSALVLMAEGDYDRALVELRNVFQLIPNHFDARHAIAKILFENRGNAQGSYRQYLRLAEQYPEDLKARVRLSQLAFSGGNWDELQRHGAKAIEIAPDNQDVRIIAAAMAYQIATADDNVPARREAVTAAEKLLATSPDNVMLQELVLDNLLRDGEFPQSLVMLGDLTAEFPTEKRYWRQRLQILFQLGDAAEIEAQLLDLVARFPDDVEEKTTLVRYYLSRNELDKAEKFLRQLVTESAENEFGARVDLVRFLTELRSLDAARVEINAAITEESDPTVFVVLGAALDFSSGEQARAIASMEELIDTSEPSEQLNNVKVSLARMLLDTGNDVGARSLVESVLAEEGNNIDALKMNARWLIEADDTDAAIAGLRTALDRDANDAEALSLMSEAYSRSGRRDLSRDFLSLAVEASGNAPEETIRYVNVLIAEERYLPAEDILLPALRIAPADLRLLQTAGRLYLEMDDMGRTRQVANTLRRIATPQANQLAIQIDAERLNREAGAEEALAFLERAAGAADASMASQLMLLRARIATDDIEGALKMAQELVAENPDEPSFKAVLATTYSVAGQLANAEGVYRDLLEEFPNQVSFSIEISRLRTRQEDPDGARSTLVSALETKPNDPTLLWAQASYLEEDGDIDSAIDIYEALYERDTTSIIVANNLASLLATYRTDQASLERAWQIARRFRDTEIPALQDTYGWITHRRGESEEAIVYLEPAAEGLSLDPIVQFHFAEALFAVGRKEDALVQYRLVLDLAGATDTRPQIGIARARIQEIEVQ